MFGMGFMEILLIAVIAIIALGPEKLPTAMVEIAKFLKKFKSGIEDAKSTLDNELNISEMKEEAAKYKAQIESAKATLNLKENVDLGLNDIINEDKTKKSDTEEKNEGTVSLKEPKKKKEKKESKEETPETTQAEDKFKIKLEDFDNTEETK
ncbi:twin arginine translocation system, TatB protein [Halarcobacter ebronensis]|uniref:Sec-independent protein translocase protein TatB homolog n=2 Tax=Halarcobacter ebronensis TaxID=1462615 RepID=A0A4Q1AU58_9BACT|nr:Sec-independent protein translocase protein TatB [Halarcobacter ebronensis]QKF82200.1 twin arginine translocation system, TatB protein [Halarcobacter ebronensis]RXK03422.1 twin-arginine translocase subunit TatB [Halarcobacter ebronensis]